MIYLDGSRFFFDIEGCFSKSVEQAREQNKEIEGDKYAKELCTGFAKFLAQSRNLLKPEKIIPWF